MRLLCMILERRDAVIQSMSSTCFLLLINMDINADSKMDNLLSIMQSRASRIFFIHLCLCFLGLHGAQDKTIQRCSGT